MSQSDLSRIPPQWPNRKFSQSRRIENLDWHFQLSRHSNPKALSILLIHGTGSSAHSWSEIFESLAKNYTVIAVDLPGHGFTKGAKKPELHIDEIAKSLKKLLTELDIQIPDVMIGHSAGSNCTLALSLLLDKPPQAIIGLNPSFVSPPSLYNYFLGPLINPIATSGFMASILASSIPYVGMIDKLLDSTNSILSPQQREPYNLLYKEHSHIYGSMNFMAASNIPELLKNSSQLKTAFTFLVAAQDPWVPQNALLPMIHQYFPDATIKIEEGGHLFHEVNPQRALAVIQEVLETIKSQQPIENA
jgi:magnesium chelatase accessory protein